MKKYRIILAVLVIMIALSGASASAVENGIVKVGLRYGTTAMFAANLENAAGSGYDFGYFDASRSFQKLGGTDHTAITMVAAGKAYLDSSGSYSASAPSGTAQVIGPWHVELDGYPDYETAQWEAERLGGYPAWIGGTYKVRVGSYESQNQAALAAEELQGMPVSSSATGVLVTVSRTTEVLFEFDQSGANLGVRPQGAGTATWFRGYQYEGAFEYSRKSGGSLAVINVIDLESYVKGVIPYEMSGSWAIEALKAQAVCARTYACTGTKHLSAYGFDVCNTVDCQVYYGLGSGSSKPTETSNRAVEETAGQCLYYQGRLTQDPVYHSCDGGATEDAENVWGGKTPYLIGKADPYESQITIPSYRYSVTYTAAELSWILDQKGYGVGTVQKAYISEYTPVGNVHKVTFVGTGGTKTVSGETCRTIFSSSTYNKSVSSMRFEINGSTGGSQVPAASASPVSSGVRSIYAVGQRLDSLGESYVLTESGLNRVESGTAYVITESGVSAVSEEQGSGAVPAAPAVSASYSAGQAPASASSTFTITGTGHGHNVGMSQWGAKAMADQGYSYEDILHFYYTGVEIQSFR